MSRAGHSQPGSLSQCEFTSYRRHRPVEICKVCPASQETADLCAGANGYQRVTLLAFPISHHKTSHVVDTQGSIQPWCVSPSRSLPTAVCTHPRALPRAWCCSSRAQPRSSRTQSSSCPGSAPGGGAGLVLCPGSASRAGSCSGGPAATAGSRPAVQRCCPRRSGLCCSLQPPPRDSGELRGLQQKTHQEELLVCTSSLLFYRDTSRSWVTQGNSTCSLITSLQLLFARNDL